MQHYKKEGPTLTNVTHGGRVAVKFGLIALVVIMVGRVLLEASIAYYKALNPPPPPPPTVGFGKLPALIFPSETEAVNPTSYLLELPSGEFPEFGDRAKVFFMPKPALGLLSDQKAKEIAERYNFREAPSVLGDNIYRWSQTSSLNSTLDIDVKTFTFDFKTDYLSKPELLLEVELPSEFDAVQKAKRFLEASKVLPADIATSSGEIVYKKSLGGELADAVSISDADFIEVDINRYPIDGLYRMYTPEGLKGSIHAVLTNEIAENNGVVEFENNYHDVDYTQVHTYPLRTAEAAFEDIKAGNGYVAHAGLGDEAIIREVVMAYYDTFEYQQYLQPIYVFKGDNGFLAYSSALSDDVIE